MLELSLSHCKISLIIRAAFVLPRVHFLLPDHFSPLTAPTLIDCVLVVLMGGRLAPGFPISIGQLHGMNIISMKTLTLVALTIYLSIIRLEGNLYKNKPQDRCLDFRMGATHTNSK